MWVSYGYFFFFKQKTAYEMLRSLVGSEMCIRDSDFTPEEAADFRREASTLENTAAASTTSRNPAKGCLLYTSDAADDLLCVDLGGRRIIKKKTVIMQQ